MLNGSFFILIDFNFYAGSITCGESSAAHVSNSDSSVFCTTAQMSRRGPFDSLTSMSLPLDPFRSIAASWERELDIH